MNMWKITFTLFCIFLHGVVGQGSKGSQGSNLREMIQEMYKSCNEGRTSCVGMPSGCISSSHCMYMASVSANGDGKMHTFKVLDEDGSPSSNYGNYVAVGIAENGRNMANATLVSCSSRRSGVFWSVRTTTPDPVAFPNYFKIMQESREDGKLFCMFEMASQFQEHGHNFDLTKEKYAVLLAKGPLKDDNSGKPGYHNTNHKLFEPMSLSSANPLFGVGFSLASVMMSMLLWSMI